MEPTMVSDAEPEIETRALALTSIALAFSTIRVLRKSRRLSKIETDGLFAGVLEVLESFPVATDPALQTARQIVDHMARIVANDGVYS
jgi:hypothetical protein